MKNQTFANWLKNHPQDKKTLWVLQNFLCTVIGEEFTVSQEAKKAWEDAIEQGHVECSACGGKWYGDTVVEDYHAHTCTCGCNLKLRIFCEDHVPHGEEECKGKTIVGASPPCEATTTNSIVCYCKKCVPKSEKCCEHNTIKIVYGEPLRSLKHCTCKCHRFCRKCWNEGLGCASCDLPSCPSNQAFCECHMIKVCDLFASEGKVACTPRCEICEKFLGLPEKMNEIDDRLRPIADFMSQMNNELKEFMSEMLDFQEWLDSSYSKKKFKEKIASLKKKFYE